MTILWVWGWNPHISKVPLCHSGMMQEQAETLTAQCLSAMYCFSAQFPAPNTAGKITSAKGMFKHWESTEKVLLLPLGRFSSWWQWPVKCWRWKVWFRHLSSTKMRQNLQLWCQQLSGHMHKAMMMVTRNKEEWFLKYMKYISNEPFSSLFSARTFFFFLQGI